MKKLLQFLITIILVCSSFSTHASDSTVLFPFDLAKKQTYVAYLINRWNDKCKNEAHGLNNKYLITVEPQKDHADIFIKKEVDSYTKQALLSVEDVAQTNALDFASFNLYPDGTFRFANPQDNVKAFKKEKEEIEAIFSKDAKYFGRSIALGVAMDRFEETLEKKILQRYGFLFDISRFKYIGSPSSGNLDPAIYSYASAPFLDYKASYFISVDEFIKVTSQLESVGFKIGGRCDPATLEKMDKASLSYNFETDMCMSSQSTKTTYTYIYSEPLKTLKSIEIITSSNKDAIGRTQSCSHLEIN